MELDEYLPMFLAEMREHLEHLNLAVVRIEERPDDRHTVDEIFRIAHSMKGMSATMGFAGMAALTHKMEDVFELLRQRSGGVHCKAIDVLLACLDALEGAAEAIDATGAESLSFEPLLQRLDSLIRARTPAQAAARQGGDAPPPDLLDNARGRRVVRVCARLADDAPDIPLRAAESGGGSGGTIRVYVGDASVTSRVAGGSETVVLGALAVAA